ncbi:protein jag [Paenibacillus albiflavus]|uniref:RNA-binding protein KhpB n=1 Tax=Paenibacillus albiflavus TaxID=2545760 RepID=A0A4R4ECI6_9BACL|nr:RNA-binding cell elongation regulator Jag/EloR [Paenibacillus albiflavus]TCZ75665.1 protein jag [Paenibacillus albiflavus]
MKNLIVSAKTIEEAIKSGLAQLNVTEDRVKVNVLEQPTKGLFGLFGSKNAKVELEVIPDPVEEAIVFLQDLMKAMQISVTINRSKDKEYTLLELSGPELGILIGKRGQTLDALQYLVGIVANRYSSSFIRIVLDAENFRERRKQTLEDLANKLANRVLRTRKDVVLEPMNAQERKVIHTVLQNHANVKTFSKGEEPNRRIVITMRT